MKQGVQDTPGLRLVADSDLCIVAFAAEPGFGISLDGLAKRMDDLGWSMFVAQNPKCVSVCLGDQHTTLWKEWVQDLGMCTAAMLQHSGAGSTASPASPAPSADIKGPYSAAGSVKSSAERKVLSDRLKDYVESMFTVTPQPPAGKL